MADYTFKGLTGILGTITVADPTTTTIDDVIALIATEEGLPTQYYGISVEGNPSINDITYGDSTTPIGTGGLEIAVSDRFICTIKQTGLTKEDKQKQKLDIAAVKRSDTYDITQLPTQYSGNDVVDNPNVGGLVARRPWNTP